MDIHAFFSFCKLSSSKNIQNGFLSGRTTKVWVPPPRLLKFMCVFPNFDVFLQNVHLVLGNTTKVFKIQDSDENRLQNWGTGSEESVPKVLHHQLFFSLEITADDTIPSVRIPDEACRENKISNIF